MKVMTVVGTRPELIKLSEIIKKLDTCTDHVFVHTGQNSDYELNEIFYKDLDLRKPNYQLEWKGKVLGGQIGSNFSAIQSVLTKEKPDALVILGDTNSGIAAGYLAKRMKIPLFHLEAGNRCFDDNVPEEINRRILDHIADVNLVYTQQQRLYLMDEGIAKDRVFVMGSPMKEVLDKHMANIQFLETFKEQKLEPGEYLVVSLHRQENVDDNANFEILMHTLNTIASTFALPIILSTHPRTAAKLDGQRMNDLIRVMPPFGFYDYIQLQRHARCVISDSGTIAEESALLNFPAITVRNAIERPEAIDAGSILMTGVNENNILNCLRMATRPNSIPADYNVDNCSERVLKVILGYTQYVNRYVWHGTKTT